MSWNLQHPAITHAINCGEDIEEPACICDICKEEIYHGEMMYTASDGRVFCPDCMKTEIDELGIEYVAEALGFEVTKIA